MTTSQSMPTTDPDQMLAEMADPVYVVAGIILNSEQSSVLVSQRGMTDPHSGKWEFPGGKIDPGESPVQALVRELEEELGINVKTAKLYENLDFQYPHQQVNLRFFLVTDYSGYIHGREGQRIDWVPLEELARIDMLEANNLIIKRLQISPTGI